MKQFYFLLFFLICGEAFAQVAVGGTSDNSDQVYWLTWDDSIRDEGWNGYLQNKEYVWHYEDDIRIIATVSGLSTTGGNVQAYTPGDWKGDGLGWMYTGPEGERIHDGGAVSMMGVPNSGLVNGTDGNLVQFNIDIELQFYIEGDWLDVDYPGMVIADAEELNGDGEYISAEIRNSGSDTEWQLIDKREYKDEDGNKNSEYYGVEFSEINRKGKIIQKFHIQPTNKKIGNQAVFFARGASGLGNVAMKGGGKTALAIGFVLPFDVSTADEYCEVKHYIDDFAPVETIGSGKTDLDDLDETPLNAIPTAYIGSSLNPLDNNSIHPDDLEVNFTQDEISIKVQVTNTKAEPATLYWWMDFNNDKIFAKNEVKVFENIVKKESSEMVELVFTEADFPSEYIGKHLRVGDLHSRLRITTTVLEDDENTGEDERSCALAVDGEVEDYVFDVRGISISGEVFMDADGMSDMLIDKVFEGEELEFSEQITSPLYAYLLHSDNETIAGKTLVEADGSYSITNMNHGSYVLALSQLEYEVGEIFESAATNHLPGTWEPMGEMLGLNNASVTENLFDDEINARVPIETPDAGMDITEVNFGLNQPPVVADVSVTTGAYQSVEVPVLDQAEDRQGKESILVSSLQLLDEEGLPVTGNSLDLEGVGSFQITEESQISFTPVNTFHGKSVSIRYSVTDRAGLESLPGLLSIEVERQKFIMVNPMLPSRLTID